MQGQQGKTVSFTETLEIDRASSSSRKGPPETHLTGFMLSPDNIHFMGSLGEQRSLGVASSSNCPYRSNTDVWKAEYGGLSNAVRHGPRIEDQFFGQGNGAFSLDNAGINPVFVEGYASSSIPQRIDSRGECVNLHKYGGSNSNQIFPTRSGSQVYPSIPSATGGYVKEANGVRLVSSSDGRTVPCKRKFFEEHVGPSSIIQNPNFPQPMACNLRYTTPPCLNMNALPTTQQLPEQLGHGLSFNMAGDAGARGVPNTESSEISYRNFRLRINSSAQNDLMATPLSTPTLASNGNPGVGLAPQSSSRVLVANRSLELPPPSLSISPASQGPRLLVQVPIVVPGGHTARLRINSAAQNALTSTPLSAPSLAYNGNPGVVLAPQSSSRVPVANHSLELQPPSLSSGPASQGPRSSVQVPVVVPRGHSARWTRAAPRNVVSSSGAVNPNESTSSDSTRNMLQHSVFASNSSSSSARGLMTASSSSFRGHVNSVPGGSSSPSVPQLPHHGLAPQHNHHHLRYPRSIIGSRRQLSTIGSDPRGAQNIQVSNTLGPAVPPQDVLLSSASGQNTAGHRYSLSRSAIGTGRQGDRVVRSFHPVRTFSAREGRRILASEIRNALELVRRGDGNIRLEDVMMLDPSMLRGFADLYDRHRNMRLDVDNMSYEELLALEERIGNVCTGLNEETISTLMKQRKYSNMEKTKMEVESCCVCQEEYNEGEDLGTLECGHDFHRDCIKQWLMQKNLCPICKTTALST